MKNNNQKHYNTGGGLYRGVTVSIKLLDAVIIGGLVLMAFLIFASV